MPHGAAAAFACAGAVVWCCWRRPPTSPNAPDGAARTHVPPSIKADGPLPDEIFLSYGRGEATELAKALFLGLSQRGFTVFLDTAARGTPAIPGGHSWEVAIYEAIANCRVFVPLYNDKFVSSPHCAAELRAAEAGKKIIVPIMVDEFEPQNCAPSIASLQWCVHTLWERVRRMIR